MVLNVFIPAMLSAAKHLGPPREILRFAQDDNRGNWDDNRAIDRSFASLSMAGGGQHLSILSLFIGQYLGVYIL